MMENAELKQSNVSDVKPWILGGKDEQIIKADAGTLIAFIDRNGKPRTGKLVSRDEENKTIVLVTEFNREFTVGYDKVMWVKFGERWPKAIIVMLKEYKNGKFPNVVERKERH